jgi:hypothetical protein
MDMAGTLDSRSVSRDSRDSDAQDLGSSIRVGTAFCNGDSCFLVMAQQARANRTLFRSSERFGKHMDGLELAIAHQPPACHELYE